MSHNTNEWTKNIAGYSSSPSNLINLGESPPTQPSSYEDRLSNFGWNTREQRGIPSSHPLSASPPAANRQRPLSYNHFESHKFSAFDDHRSQVPSYGNRRSSMYSPSRYSPQPPLPHQPQAHFYGAPDPSLMMLDPQTSGLVPGERGFYCGVDKLPNPSHSSASKSNDSVVLTGYDGGIRIQLVTKRGIAQLWNVDGLRGGVFNAKILPWTMKGARDGEFPLIAVVVHGPAWKSSDETHGDDVPASEKTSTTPTGSIQGSPRMPGYQERDTDEYYQTTVEIYSICRNTHIATLLALPRTAKNHLSEPPPPEGSLTVRADNGNIVVASGLSGETWIFRQGDMYTTEKFVCIGKVWTTVQHGVTVDAAPNGLHGDWNLPDLGIGRKQYKASILSLNGRWLAYCPPSPSSQLSLGAIIPSGLSKTRVAGLSARAPPQLPAVNCLVETPGGESMVKQILQVGTQKFIEGATYLGGQGVQAWNSYWNKSAQSPSPPAGYYQVQQNMVSHFPPTHASGAPASLIIKEPGLISILDLGALASKSTGSGGAIHPLATFRVPQGCSFLSFAPSGLALFTASSKGDVQFVWDLMRVQYAKSSFLKGSFPGAGTQNPHVRQIAQFSRMTIARIVDVVWTSPHGERAAMVTEPGTVHILDLPASAFIWPPPRRKIAVSRPEEEAGPSALSATGMATSAVTSLWTAARPLVNRRRQSTAGMSPMNVKAQAGHGTHALAAGISRSVGAATGRMNELRKSGTAKLHLPSSVNIPARGCVLLLNGKRCDSVIVVGGGIVRFYTIKNRRADRPADKQKASRGAKFVEFRLPSLPSQIAPRDVNQADELELTEGDLDPRFGNKSSATPPKSQHGTESSIPQAEIESNAPYQPFHTDRRVGLHIYSHEDTTSSPSVSAVIYPLHLSSGKPSRNVKPISATLLAFGRPIKSTRLDVGPPHLAEDDLSSSLVEQGRALPSSAIERVLRISDSSEHEEQIVVTTRRRKGVSRTGTAGEPASGGDEEGFFEDDCEVLDFASQRV